MKFRPRFDHTRTPATDHLQLEADRRFDETFRKTHCDWQREHRYYARDLSELEKVRASADSHGQRHRHSRPTTSYRTHERARHTLIGTIYRRRAKLRREQERHEQLEALRPPPPSLPPEPSFEELHEWEMQMAAITLEILEIDQEGAPELVDEMIEYHRNLYPERYWPRQTRMPQRLPGSWRNHLYYYHRLEYFEAA